VYPLAKLALFRLDAERAHELVLGGLALAGRSVLARRWLRGAYALPDPRLRVDAFGLAFPNPLGLAAGLDKDGVAVAALGALGFGSVEVGSVTALAQAGNPAPRLFRLVEDEALVNRMGFNNAGAAALAARLARYAAAEPWAPGPRPVVGVNVGKSRVVELEDAPDDYRAALGAVWQVADYLVVNVSSPNTPGLRSLQEREPLARVLEVTAGLRATLGAKPVLLKLSPDLDDAQLADAVATAHAHGVAGLVATNTTLLRDGLRSPHAVEAGGLSGRPLAARALAVLERLRELSDLPLVSVGGVHDGATAVARLQAGADLLQVYTGFVYRGPGLVREVLAAVLAAMERRGVERPADLKGTAGA